MSLLGEVKTALVRQSSVPFVPLLAVKNTCAPQHTMLLGLPLAAPGLVSLLKTTERLLIRVWKNSRPSVGWIALKNTVPFANSQKVR